MTKILHIETANEYCSLALSRDNQLIGIRETNEKNAHSRVITVFISELLNDNNCKPSEIDAVAVSMGPGSYTGLRIGLSVAKGLCFALDKPLIAVGTLQAMAAGSIELFKETRDFEPGMVFCPMIDARRMEVYVALFDGSGKEIRETKAEIINENSFQKKLQDHIMVFSGSGSQKCKGLFMQNANALFLDGFVPSARFMIPIALKKFSEKQFENVAYCEPFYLKSFVAGIPRVKGLR
jgi:tRNA threonylcarbamoyladenosine biosynthesis protein TsaB